MEPYNGRPVRPQRRFVAGPDSTARWHVARVWTRYAALRFSGGLGPLLLGVPADQVCDETPDLEEVWPSGQARALAERVEADPGPALERWAVERSRRRELDPFGPRVLRMAIAGMPVAVMADRLGISSRQLHRRCLPVFGYGPRRLGRVVRLSRALDQSRSGVSLAQVATECGYVDQGHFCREVRALVGTTPGLLRKLDLR